MLKKILLVSAALCGTLLWAGTGIETNWNTQVLKPGATMVNGWTQNRQSIEKGGKGQVVTDDLSEKTVFRVIGGIGSTDYYFVKPVDAQVGDTLQIRIIARGKGAISVGYYAYDAKMSWFRTAHGTETVKLDDNPQEYKVEIPVENGLKEQITARIRPTVSVLPAATAYIGLVEVNLKKSAAK